MTTPVAALERATKRFGGTTAVAEVSFEVAQGSVLALLGANGAGKTTALSLLLGLRAPDGGSARLFGRDPRQPRNRRRLGTTPQESAFPQTLRVCEVLRLVAAHYEHPARLDDLASRFLLDELLERQTGGLSGGERRRLGLALALVGGPALLVLDEPTGSLDVESRRAAWAAFRGYVAAGGTILLTTHNLEEAERLATAVVVLERGRVLARGSVSELRARAGYGRIRFCSEGLAPGACDGRVVDDGTTITIESADPPDTVRRLVLAGARLEGLSVEPLPLEEALRRIRGEAP